MVGLTFVRRTVVISTGVVLAAAMSVGTASAVANIGLGSSNTHGVWCVQYAVNNYFEAVHPGQRPLPQDHIFGPKTEDGVKWFQAITDNDVDGIVGPATGEDILVWDSDPNRTQDYCAQFVPQ